MYNNVNINNINTFVLTLVLCAIDLYFNSKININLLISIILYTLNNIDTILKLFYKKKIYECEDCPICMEEIKEEKDVLVCGHVFHKNCILEWKKIKSACPFCNIQLL